MDAASFTWVRLLSGAVMLVGLLAARGRTKGLLAQGSWTSALTLLGYALLFSYAFRSIPAGVGALVLFASVQLTMLTAAVRDGTGPRGLGWLGVALACGGLVALTLPGATAPDLTGVLMMAASGIGWGLYSLYGRSATTATQATAANFVRSAAIAVPLCIAITPELPVRGLVFAITSGAITSGLGYVLWYTVLPTLGTTRAAVLQLAVPVIATFAGAALLAETLTPRLLLASAAILGGIAGTARHSPAPRA